MLNLGAGQNLYSWSKAPCDMRVFSSLQGEDKRQFCYIDVSSKEKLPAGKISAIENCPASPFLSFEAGMLKLGTSEKIALPLSHKEDRGVVGCVCGLHCTGLWNRKEKYVRCTLHLPLLFNMRPKTLSWNKLQVSLTYLTGWGPKLC